MKILNIMSLAAVAAAMISAVSCANEEFTRTGELNGEAVYFPVDAVTEYTLDEETTSVTVPVRRSVTDDEFTVSILADWGEMSETDQSVFTVPSSVTFSAGEEEASLVIAVDNSAVEEGKEYTIGFLINDEANVSQYGNKTLYITLAKETWDLLGTGKFRDDWFTAMWQSAPVVEVDVPIYEHKSQKGLYMLEAPYGWPYLEAFFGGSQEAIESELVTYAAANITIDATDPAQVSISRQSTGITDNDPAYGLYEIATAESVYGTLENGIITFPAGGLKLFCVAGDMDTNPNGLFRVVLPGYEARDYSVSVEYAGMRVASDNKTATAVLDFSYGADVTGISYVFVSGDVTSAPEEYVAGVVDGTAENICTVDGFVAGEGSASVEAELAPGLYTIVAVPADVSGALSAENAVAVNFYFPGAGGNAAPECDIAAALYKVTEYPDAAGYIEQCPDYSSVVYELKGSEIKSLKMYLNTTEVINSIEGMGMTVQEVVDAYGSDLSADFLQELNAVGKTWNIFINLNPSTFYTFVVSAENSYGETALIISKPFVTDALPYSGELAIGKYYMSCEYAGETFENIFEVLPTQSSETDFFVRNIGIANGSSWYAEYDSEASTLTLTGYEEGYEDFGMQFGVPYYYYDEEETMYYGFYSYTSDTSNGKNPCVFSVDPQTKELAALNNDFAVILQDAETMEGIGLLGYYTAGTEVSLYEGSGQSSRMAASRMQNLSGLTSAASLREPAVAGSLATLKVATRKCEPLSGKISHKVARDGFLR